MIDIHLEKESNWKEKNSDKREDEDTYFLDSQRRYKELLALASNLPQNSSILEISPMFGHVAITLRLRGYKVFVTDVFSQVCKREIKFKKYNIPISVCDLNYDAIPYPSNSFDCVLFSEVFEHIQPNSIDHTLSEIHRVLKCDGLIIFSTPNLFDLGNRLLMLLGKTYLDPSHVKEYSLPDLEFMFKKANLNIVSSWYSLCYAYHHSLSAWWANVAKPFLLPLRVIYPRFRTTIFIVGEKK